FTQQSMHPVAFNQSSPKQETLPKAVLESVTNGLPATDFWFGAATKNAPLADANHILYLVRANQLFVAGHQQDLATGLSKVSAKTLFLPAKNDLLLQPYLAKQVVDTLKEQGKSPQSAEIDGIFGHLDGVYNIQSKAAKITEFLDN